MTAHGVMAGGLSPTGGKISRRARYPRAHARGSLIPGPWPPVPGPCSRYWPAEAGSGKVTLRTSARHPPGNSDSTHDPRPSNPFADGRPGPGRWHTLAERVLEGQPLGREQGLEILRSDDEELLDLLAAAYRVRRRWFGNRVHLNFLVNARCGACSEDCGYCSQSKVSTGRHRPLQPRRCRGTAGRGADGRPRQAKTYCIVTSGLRPSVRDLDTVLGAVARIKAECGLKICVSLGLLTLEQSRRLKAGGVDRVNHNLNTSRRFYPASAPRTHTRTASTPCGRCASRAWKSARAASSAWARKTPTWSIWPSNWRRSGPRPCR